MLSMFPVIVNQSTSPIIAFLSYYLGLSTELLLILIQFQSILNLVTRVSSLNSYVTLCLLKTLHLTGCSGSCL